MPSSDSSLEVKDVAHAISDIGECVRDDVRVPVLVFQSETDIIVLGGGQADQCDTDAVRVWELAGAAHADTYLLNASRYDDGRLDPSRLADLLRPTSNLQLDRQPLRSMPDRSSTTWARLLYPTCRNG